VLRLIPITLSLKSPKINKVGAMLIAEIPFAKLYDEQKGGTEGQAQFETKTNQEDNP
jgi:hypothetical protein